MQKIEVGKPFPGPVPRQDGATIEIGPDGDLLLLVQLRNPSPAEAAALKAGFSRYTIYQGEDGLACWVFKFPSPLGYLDAPIHAGLYHDGRGERLAEKEWNMLQVYGLDGETVRLVRICGLQHEAAQMFFSIVRSQVAKGVDLASYNASVNQLFAIKSEEIFRRGKSWKHLHDTTQ
jgi:hypothetical protein